MSDLVSRQPSITGHDGHHDGAWDVLPLADFYGLDDKAELAALSRSVLNNPSLGTIIDLTGLNLLDSVVLSWIIRTKVEHDTAGRQLRLASATRQHLSVLNLRGLADAFPTYPSVESARSIMH